MNKKKFLIIGYGNMGRLHSEILSDLLNDVFFDVVDIEDKKIGKQNYNQINVLRQGLVNALLSGRKRVNV